jgi:dolichol-phosphate mannosyltransferase
VGSTIARDSVPTTPRRHRRTRVRGLLRTLVSPSRFAIVGLIGIVVNQVALYAFTDLLGVNYLLSAVLASQVSTLNNFVFTELWVFRGRELRGHVVLRYIAFDLVNMATLLIRIPVLWVLTDIFGLYYLWSNLVAIVVTFGVRYLVADNWIWAGRDRWDQRAVDGAYQYDIGGLVRLQSPVALPELASMNVTHVVEPDIVIRRTLTGGWPRLRISTSRGDDRTIRYREQMGVLGAAFDVRIPRTAGPVELDANWLLVWSHHVLYTNMVEPLLRFVLVDRGYVLLHSAAVDTDSGAVVMSALTDTGKTSTVLRLLMHRSWGFLADDMVIVAPDGAVVGYPKPMTLSSHTMSAVNDQALPPADRAMLAIRSKLHSREGRAVGHAMGRMPLPIVTINSWVQILVPPPKYHVTSLVDCEVVDRSQLDAVILMERGEPLAELPSLDATVDRLLLNTDDAYTFPPFASFAPLITIGGRDHDALRTRERELLASAVQTAWCVRVRVRGHNWSDLIPTLIAERRPLLEPGAEPGPAEAALDPQALVAPGSGTGSSEHA